MYRASNSEIEEIYLFYKNIVEYMNETGPRIGWNIDIYPDYSFVEQSVNAGSMFVEKKDEQIICAAVVNHDVNPEYDEIDWEIKGPKEKLATIHALAIAPDFRGTNTSDEFLANIEKHCKDNGDLAIHFDVIEGNEPAYKLYMRNRYTEVAIIKMYYESVGTKEFTMMEKVL